ncbi:hypothetical protein MASR2M15_17320 [Anaerolineales bacterium]
MSHSVNQFITESDFQKLNPVIIKNKIKGINKGVNWKFKSDCLLIRLLISHIPKKISVNNWPISKGSGQAASVAIKVLKGAKIIKKARALIGVIMNKKGIISAKIRANIRLLGNKITKKAAKKALKIPKRF